MAERAPPPQGVPVAGPATAGAAPAQHPPMGSGYGVAFPSGQKVPYKFEAAERRLGYTGKWDTDLIHAVCAQPMCCCIALFCPCCTSWEIRRRYYKGDMSQYVCCGGYLPCAGKCGEKSCPECCLCLETWLCFAQSVAVTRWLLQDDLELETTACDKCIIATMITLQYLACIMQCAAAIAGSGELDTAADIVDLLADIVWCTVCACMAAQHANQIEVRDGRKAPAADAGVQAVAPAAPMQRT